MPILFTEGRVVSTRVRKTQKGKSELTLEVRFEGGPWFLKSYFDHDVPAELQSLTFGDVVPGEMVADLPWTGSNGAVHSSVLVRNLVKG